MTNSTSLWCDAVRVRRLLLRGTTILCTGLVPAIIAVPAAAQVAAPAPVRNNIDANGVDLFLGTMNVDGPTLSVGDGKQQGMTWKKVLRGAGGWGDTLVGTLTVSGTTTYVSFGGTTDRFTKSGSTFISTEGNGATLTQSGTNYTYTASDGTIAAFTTSYTGTAPYRTVQGNVTSVTRPNDVAFSYTYESYSYCSNTKYLDGSETCTARNNAYRISSITSNSLYKISFSYGNWDPGSIDDNVAYYNLPGWGDITSVTMTNTAVTGGSSRSQSFSGNFTISDAMSRSTAYRSTYVAAAGGVVLAGVTHPGRTSEDVTATYDGSGRVFTLTTPVGTTTYTYSDSGDNRTTIVTDPLLHATTYVFSISLQRPISVTDATGRTITTSYDGSGRPMRVTAPEGNYTQYTYDARGNATETRTVAKAGSGLADIVTTADYDATCGSAAKCNQPNWTKDAKGNQTDYSYDATTGNVLTVESPAPTAGGARPTASYTYTSVNGVQMMSGSSTCSVAAACVGTANETKTSLSYNANGLPITTSVQAGDGSLTATTAIGYDDVGNRTSVDGPLAGSDDTILYRYDADRELVGVVGPDPDGAGSLKRRAARATYNERGITTLVERGTVAGTSDGDWSAFAPLQAVTTTLDPADRKAQVTVSAGGTAYAVTQYSYDADGRLDCTAMRMKPATWTSSLPSACIATTGSGDADRIVKTTYDNADRVLKTTSAFGTADAADEASATYSDNGKVLALTDAEGNRTGYAHDGFDRLMTTSYPSPAKGAGTSSATDYEQLTYDANGNVISRRLRDAATITYSYDALDRLTLKDLPGSEPDVTYAYDLLGRPLSAASSAQTLTFTYDALGRNLSQASPLGTVAYQYDLAGRRTRMTWPDTFYVTYDYDPAGEMTALKESGTTILAGFSYDDLGRRTALTRGNGVTTTYAYDAVSRLTGLVQDPAGTTYDLSLGFSYNPAGQIASATRSNSAYSWTGAANVNRGYTSNGLNQYTASGATALGYDARGNLTTSGSDAYTYSSENLLLTGPSSAALTYDPLLRLYQVSSATGGTTKFVYDGDNIIGQVTATGGGDRRYVLVPGSDEVLVEYKLNNATKNWKLADERGSVIASTDATGAAVSFNTYDEYGIPGATNGMRYQYTGQVWLAELGMYYYKARMYSPTLGRFMQTDPIGYGDGMNWYNYTDEDPVNGSDPTGLSTHPDDPNGDVVVCGGCHKSNNVQHDIDFRSWLGGGQSFAGTGNGSGSGGPVGAEPSQNSKITCNTKLPNGKTVGDYVRQARTELQNSYYPDSNTMPDETDSNPLASAMDTFLEIAKPHGQIDFKTNFAGQAPNELLGNAGNFAYYAIGAGYIPNTALDLGAGAYGLYGAAKGTFPFSYLTGRFYSNGSAKMQRAPGLAAGGC